MNSVIEGLWAKVSCCKVAKKFIKNGFAPLVHGLKVYDTLTEILSRTVH